ncbi:MAG TPA: M20/M25/M40 family metallo-hydrolase [Steroidobacteraceae bacterium]
MTESNTRTTSIGTAVLIVLMTQTAAGRGAPSDAIAESTVRAHMGFLASDAMNGRGSGSRDEWITATYIAAQMRRDGLEPLGDAGDFVQTVDIARTEVVGDPVFSIGKTSLRRDEFFPMKMYAAEASGPLQKYAAGVPIRSGAVLLMPADMGFEAKINLQGAQLVLWHDTTALRAHWPELTRRPIRIGPARLTAIASPAKPSTGPSQIMLNPDAYAAVAALPDGSPLNFTAHTQETTFHTWNAVARLSGADSRERSEIVLLTAHLDHLGTRETGPDHIYNGADDDASGSIAVLTLAEALSQGPKLNRTVVFAWFGSEEAGGYGASYFVQKPVVPLDKIVANLEFEMIGRPDAAIAPHTLWLTGWERTNLGPQLAAHGARLVADPHPAEQFFARSDNFTLARRGVVAQTVSSFGLHADYHQVSDDIQHIDFAHMTESIQSLLAPIRWLADSDFKPDWLPGGRPE